MAACFAAIPFSRPPALCKSQLAALRFVSALWVKGKGLKVGAVLDHPWGYTWSFSFKQLRAADVWVLLVIPLAFGLLGPTRLYLVPHAI